jgi:hypothetical protein
MIPVSSAYLDYRPGAVGADRPLRHTRREEENSMDILARFVAHMTVRADLCTRPAALHGGAIMAFADRPTLLVRRLLTRVLSERQRQCILAAGPWSGRRGLRPKMEGLSR